MTHSILYFSSSECPHIIFQLQQSSSPHFLCNHPELNQQPPTYLLGCLDACLLDNTPIPARQSSQISTFHLVNLTNNIPWLYTTHPVVDQVHIYFSEIQGTLSWVCCIWPIQSHVHEFWRRDPFPLYIMFSLISIISFTLFPPSNTSPYSTLLIKILLILESPGSVFAGCLLWLFWLTFAMFLWTSFRS